MTENPNTEKAEIENPASYNTHLLPLDKMETAIYCATCQRDHLEDLMDSESSEESQKYQGELEKVSEFLGWAHEVSSLQRAAYLECDFINEPSGKAPFERDSDGRIVFDENAAVAEGRVFEQYGEEGPEYVGWVIEECWVERNGTIHSENGKTYDPEWLRDRNFTPYQPQFDAEITGPEVG